MHLSNFNSTVESVQDFRKRKDHGNFGEVMKREHSFVNHTSLQDEGVQDKRAVKQRRTAIVGNIGFDMFSVNYVDGYSTKKKFILVNNSAPEFDSYNFWSLIWESRCRVIVRFHTNNPKKSDWLNKIGNVEYTVGEYLIGKKVITCKYYTQLELTIRNFVARKSRKITHYQYHVLLDENVSVESAQLVLFLKMINKKQDSYIKTRSDGKKRTPGPIVLHTIGCFERAVSVCALDVCLEQLEKAKSVSVPNALLKIKSQISFDSISIEEYIFINETLLYGGTYELDFDSENFKHNKSQSVFFRSRIKKHYLALNKRLFSKC